MIDTSVSDADIKYFARQCAFRFQRHTIGAKREWMENPHFRPVYSAHGFGFAGELVNHGVRARIRCRRSEASVIEHDFTTSGRRAIADERAGSLWADRTTCYIA